MAGEPYDYLIGLVITSIIFVSTVAVLPNISYVNLRYVDEQQLRNMALETLKAILLETGYPANWGSTEPFDQNDVEKFGLASANSPSYVLDPDKVQRLVVDNPVGYVEYEKMRELLGLSDYGFIISIIPPFQVIIENERFEPPYIELEVKVLHNDGRPIAEANVEAIIIYATEGKDWALYITTENYLTDPLGICKVNKTLETSETISDVVVVFKITVADLSTVVVSYQKTPANDIANINVVGDDIILTVPEATPRGARWVDNMAVYSQGSLMLLPNGTRSNEDKLTYGEGYQVWNRTFNGLKYYDPGLLIFNFYAVDPGPKARREILVAGPYPNWLGCRVVEYGDTSRRGNAGAITLQRNVSIARTTFIVELTLWKESV